MVTFRENSGSSCNLDDLERNLAANWETAESIIMTCPGHPEVLKAKEEARGETNVGHQLLYNSQC